MTIPYGREKVTEILCNCVSLSGLQNSYVELICTRGMSPTFRRDPRDAENRFIAFAIPFGSVANPDQMENGLHAAVTPYVRIPPQSVDPTVKNYHWLDLVKGLYAAYDRGADTAILLDADGNISEGPGFNVFCVANGEISTPTASVLHGVTRQTVFEICHALNVKCQTGDISQNALRQADEVFITSTAGGIMPVTMIDGMQIGSGTPGSMTTKITDAYWLMHEKEDHRTVVNYEHKA